MAFPETILSARLGTSIGGDTATKIQKLTGTLGNSIYSAPDGTIVECKEELFDVREQTRDGRKNQYAIFYLGSATAPTGVVSLATLARKDMAGKFHPSNTGWTPEMLNATNAQEFAKAVLGKRLQIVSKATTFKRPVYGKPDMTDDVPLWHINVIA